MELSEFCSRLDDRLDTAAYAEVDASANGLQVGPREGAVEHAAFAVDGVAATIGEAIDVDADVLCVHHGLIWDGLDRLTGRTYDRVAALVTGELALYVSHLPLDGHPEDGNAARLAAYLDCTVTESFGQIGEETIGQRARADEAYSIDELRRRLATLDTGDGSVDVLPFGAEEITDVAIVTGAGADWISAAADAGVDALITGEGKGRSYHDAREAGLTVFLAGHYATETFGVRALQDLVDGWGLETTFIDHPTGR